MSVTQEILRLAGLAALLVLMPLLGVSESRVSIKATTTFGEATPGCLVLSFIDQRGRDLKKSFQRCEGSSIPEGTYRLELGDGLGQTATATVVVNRAEVLRVVAFGRRDTITFGADRVSLLGRLKGQPKLDEVWIRLVPLYAEGVIDLPVSISGEFVVPHIEDGTYLMAVLRGARALKFESVIIRRSKDPQRVEFDLAQ